MQKKLEKNIVIIAVLLLLAGLNGKAYSQTFEEARKLAFSGEREQSRAVCRAILAEGFNSDVALLLGRTFAWDSKYDSARVILNEVLRYKPNNGEAFDALADVEYWDGNYSKAIEYCDKGLLADSSANAFVLKKAKILYSDEKIVEAVNVLEKFVQKNPGHAELVKKLKEYRLDLLKNNLKISYTIDLFDPVFNRDPWQIAYLSYGRKTKLGTIIARVNRANRFNEKGVQFETDAYPKLGENSYGYLNYGFSQTGIFPKNRFGAEWYHNFPNAFEGSIGMRYLSFSGSGVDIYTATFGKYIGNYWLSVRSFVTPGSNGTSVSGLLQARRYFSDPEDYIGLRLGYGVSPDDNRDYLISKERITLKTRSVRLEYNHLFNRIWILNAGAVLGGEEIDPGKYSGYYTFDFSISRLF